MKIVIQNNGSLVVTVAGERDFGPWENIPGSDSHDVSEPVTRFVTEKTRACVSGAISVDLMERRMRVMQRSCVLETLRGRTCVASVLPDPIEREVAVTVDFEIEDPGSGAVTREGAVFRCR